METRGPDRHILFRPEALFPHRSWQVEVDEEGWEYVEPVGSSCMMKVVPCVGSFCQLVLPDNCRFTRRITRVLEYQQTRIILRVKHPYSPAIVTLAVPYPFYEGTRWWYIRLHRWFEYLIPDNDRHNTGKSIPVFADLRHLRQPVIGQSPNIDWWELDDRIQGEFQYLYGGG
ncbi:hypothetical protein NUW54_g6909 [Trametes sanguinea]|uniref:Uncharacterized protein n=1 Tax=Trametes sanguinea TaxID=158606 RepID=A0ACC1PTW2_9APHY|nr:hypothetical protein NUW54_g6909 [Trametes sanguinea]